MKCSMFDPLPNRYGSVLRSAIERRRRGRPATGPAEPQADPPDQRDRRQDERDRHQPDRQLVVPADRDGRARRASSRAAACSRSGRGTARRRGASRGRCRRRPPRRSRAARLARSRPGQRSTPVASRTVGPNVWPRHQTSKTRIASRPRPAQDGDRRIESGHRRPLTEPVEPDRVEQRRAAIGRARGRRSARARSGAWSRYGPQVSGSTCGGGSNEPQRTCVTPYWRITSSIRRGL